MAVDTSTSRKSIRNAAAAAAACWPLSYSSVSSSGWRTKASPHLGSVMIHFAIAVLTAGSFLPKVYLVKLTLPRSGGFSLSMKIV